MPTEPALLPPGATPLEIALAGGTARLSAVPIPLDALWDPAACPLAILPWLAWSLSVDSWDPAWPEATKRQAVADSIKLHRLKGTRWAVERVAARYDALLRVVEWFEANGTGVPHTFQLILPMVTAPNTAPGGPRSTAAFAEAVIADIVRVKPLREHLELVQRVDLAGGVGLQGVARLTGYFREEMALVEDASQPWATLLDDENGEPLQDDSGAFLDTAP